jgi:hypothetical protein
MSSSEDEASQPNTPREYVESKDLDGGMRVSLWKDPPPDRKHYVFLSDNYGLKHCGKMRVDGVEHMPSGVRYEPHEQGFRDFINRLHTVSVGEAYMRPDSDLYDGYIAFDFKDDNMDRSYELYFLRGHWHEYYIQNIR